MELFLRILEALLIVGLLTYSLFKLYRDENIEKNRRDLFMIRGTIWRLLLFGIIIYNFYNRKFTTIVIRDFFMNMKTSSEEEMEEKNIKRKEDIMKYYKE